MISENGNSFLVRDRKIPELGILYLCTSKEFKVVLFPN